MCVCTAFVFVLVQKHHLNLKRSRLQGAAVGQGTARHCVRTRCAAAAFLFQRAFSSALLRASLRLPTSVVVSISSNDANVTIIGELHSRAFSNVFSMLSCSLSLPLSFSCFQTSCLKASGPVILGPATLLSVLVPHPFMPMP